MNTKSIRRGLTRVLTMAAAMVIGSGSSAFACPVCFGAHETSIIDGTRLGVLVLLAITIAVQGSFVGFFLYLRQRAKHIADVELDTEWSELQRS
jgi:hypothetical protein